MGLFARLLEAVETVSRGDRVGARSGGVLCKGAPGGGTPSDEGDFGESVLLAGDLRPLERLRGAAASSAASTFAMAASGELSSAVFA